MTEFVGRITSSHVTTPHIRTCLQLCGSCPLLRELVLRRILRKWPAGASDNEVSHPAAKQLHGYLKILPPIPPPQVALLEFLATVLGGTTHRADLVVTDLRTALLSRVLACLRSPHIKVARTALVLCDPKASRQRRVSSQPLVCSCPIVNPLRPPAYAPPCSAASSRS
jgi:hypothetical protein